MPPFDPDGRRPTAPHAIGVRTSLDADGNWSGFVRVSIEGFTVPAKWRDVGPLPVVLPVNHTPLGLRNRRNPIAIR
jgi:hypothetical protein